MDKRDVLIGLEKKIHGYTDTPYFDRKSVQDIAAAFDKFVNNFNTDEMLAAAAEFANDDYVKEFMAENGMTFPKDAEEALDRGLDAVGEKMTRTHRTLQQNFMRMLLMFVQIQAAAYEAGIYDLRNEATCRQSKIMWEALCDADDFGLPHV